VSDRTTGYYDRTSTRYDELHGAEKNLEHIRALEIGWPILERLEIGSAADVGCGTGRSMAWLEQHGRVPRLVGIDPSQGLLKIAQERLPRARFEVGRGEELPLEDRSVDFALATGIMHHVDHPTDVIREMFRVANKAVLISDHNNFAFGGRKGRQLRLWLYSSGLLGFATFVKQGFKKQGYSEDDGWWYPYSLFNDFGLISSLSTEQYIFPTRPSSSKRGNLLLSQSHIAILAVKPRSEWASP
jgi:ubiquinone/menaquinone biosynthesis C-methylase UbiE